MKRDWVFGRGGGAGKGVRMGLDREGGRGWKGKVKGDWMLGEEGAGLEG